MTRVQLIGWLQDALRRRMLIRLWTRLHLLVRWDLFYLVVGDGGPIFLLHNFRKFGRMLLLNRAVAQANFDLLGNVISLVDIN